MGVDAVTVRAAQPADRPVIETLLRAMHAEAGTAALSVDKMREAIAEAMQRGILLLSLAPDGTPVGTMALVPGQLWYTDDWHMADKWLFVAHAWRRTPHARALLRAAVRAHAALSEGQTLPLFIAEYGAPGSANRSRGKARLFTKELGEPCGAIWTVE